MWIRFVSKDACPVEDETTGAPPGDPLTTPIGTPDRRTSSYATSDE
jgi:hypothetical protein